MGTTKPELTNNMKLLQLLGVTILLFALCSFAAPVPEEECEEETGALEFEPALDVPDLVIDLRENFGDDEDCEDDVVTEECEDEDVTATPPPVESTISECDDYEITTEPKPATVSECEDEEIVEELPAFEMAMPEEPIAIPEEECVE